MTCYWLRVKTHKEGDLSVALFAPFPNCRVSVD